MEGGTGTEEGARGRREGMYLPAGRPCILLKGGEALGELDPPIQNHSPDTIRYSHISCASTFPTTASLIYKLH